MYRGAYRHPFNNIFNGTAFILEKVSPVTYFHTGFSVPFLLFLKLVVKTQMCQLWVTAELSRFTLAR